MLEETYAVTPAVAKAVAAAKSEGRPVTAVGTTVVRTLESAWRDGEVRSGHGATSLFITPGYEFRVVDRLLTNFHLPKSTLLMLVSAFAGYDRDGSLPRGRARALPLLLVRRLHAHPLTGDGGSR